MLLSAQKKSLVACIPRPKHDFYVKLAKFGTSIFRCSTVRSDDLKTLILSVLLEPKKSITLVFDVLNTIMTFISQISFKSPGNV
ncbi:hypothetical protein KQX54_011755 [Cotesia glomerata]|uniref:Uncharacterized protein n=1 Tax=Cotesia glomerata TaxID=32391 RepID=A0AAV7HR02_COTGL|nr:hypothetical protein KQX54_011755 [Cotesia glomerata]